MARPAAFDREQAIDDIMHLMWRDGYERSSVKALCEKLEITRSSFYNAFGTREKLFEEVLAHYSKQSPDYAFKLATPPIDVRLLFTLVFKELCSERAADPEGRGCLMTNSVAELSNANEKLSPILSMIMAEQVERIETILEWGIAVKELPRNFDAHGAALALFNLMVGINLMSKFVREEGMLWQTVQVTLEGLHLYEPAMDMVKDEN